MGAIVPNGNGSGNQISGMIPKNSDITIQSSAAIPIGNRFAN
jgi:hypothetical protein